MQTFSKKNYHVLMLVLSFLFLGAGSLKASGNYVKNLNTGTKYRNLQQAINAASTGQNLELFGEFNGSFTISGKSLNLTGPSENHQFAILDGGKTNRVLEITGVYPLPEGTTPITVNLTNLIIQNGSADHGGGVYNTNAQLNLNNVFIINNQAKNNGGGIAHFNGNLQIFNSSIISNKASHGGGIDSINSTLYVQNCDFSYNTATQFGGGGISLTSTNGNIQQSIFTGNNAPYGGGIDNEINSSTSLYLCTVRDNGATQGAAFYNNGTLTINQSPVSQNNATGQGGGLYNTSDAILATLINSTWSFNGTSNEDADSGGAIFNAGTEETLQLDNITFVLNWPTDVSPSPED